jgi:hypothetical protein
VWIGAVPVPWGGWCRQAACGATGTTPPPHRATPPFCTWNAPAIVPATAGAVVRLTVGGRGGVPVQRGCVRRGVWGGRCFEGWAVRRQHSRGAGAVAATRVGLLLGSGQDAGCLRNHPILERSKGASLPVGPMFRVGWLCRIRSRPSRPLCHRSSVRRCSTSSRSPARTCRRVPSPGRSRFLHRHRWIPSTRPWHPS